jgi:S-(hydroxymethyl)glutathione dehydrogenase/alcohol dehydrogenase
MSAAELGIQITGRLGQTVIVGFGDWSQKISVPIDQLMLEKSITASRMGSGRVSVDIPRIAQYYLDGRFKLDELLSGRWDFAGINHAIDASKKGDGYRQIIQF